MKRHLLTMVASIMTLTGSAAAAETSWLKITQKNRACNLLVADGLAMTVTNGMLVCTGQSDAISLALDGLDSNDNMYITGGMITGVGGSNSTPSDNVSTQPYISCTLSATKGQTIAVS